jgi:hypothetical protein
VAYFEVAVSMKSMSARSSASAIVFKLAAGRRQRNEAVALRQHRIDRGDVVHRQDRPGVLRLPRGTPGATKHHRHLRRLDACLAQGFHHRQGRRNVVEREARRQENHVGRLGQFDGKVVVPPARVDHDVVVLVRHSIEFRFPGELRDVDRRFEMARLALRLPAQASPLLDVEIRQQHLASGARERDRGRARQRRFADASLLRGEQDLAGHSWEPSPATDGGNCLSMAHYASFEADKCQTSCH